MESTKDNDKTTKKVEKELFISNDIKSLPTEDFFLKHKHKKKSLIHFEINEQLAHKELSKRELVYVLELLNKLGNVL